MERLLLTTGGTGGHIFPALAVAEEARRLYPGVRILFVGSHYGPEGEWAQKAGLEFVGLPVRGFIGRGLRAVSAACGMGAALCKALCLVRSFKPQVVIGFGGYAAFAPVAAARFWGIPVAVHEQNAVAGVSNKTLGRMAHKVFLSLAGTQGFDAKKCTTTGNPVREAVAAVGQEACSYDRKHLLVMGGSQGATALNKAVIAAIPRFLEAGIEWKHQTGQRDLAWVREAYTAAGANPEWAQPFIHDMAETYRWADLVLCRSGATSVAELATAGRPAVLVPFPFATHDHQTHNARLLSETGAAMMVSEKDLEVFDMTALLVRLLGEPATLAKMGQAALAQAKPHAANTVVRALSALMAQK